MNAISAFYRYTAICAIVPMHAATKRRLSTFTLDATQRKATQSNAKRREATLSNAKQPKNILNFAHQVVESPMTEGIKHQTFDSGSAVASEIFAYKNAKSVHEVIKDVTNFPQKRHSFLQQFVR